MTKATTMYMQPIRLWSTVVNHSRHIYPHWRFQVIEPTSATPMSPTIAKVYITMGSLVGIASHESFPNIINAPQPANPSVCRTEPKGLALVPAHAWACCLYSCLHIYPRCPETNVAGLWSNR